MDKYDLGLAKDFTHWIHLKDDQPIFQKQFNLPEAHTQFIKQSLDEWLKLGVVRQSNSPYNSPIFCVPKKQGRDSGSFKTSGSSTSTLTSTNTP